MVNLSYNFCEYSKSMISPGHAHYGCKYNLRFGIIKCKTQPVVTSVHTNNCNKSMGATARGLLGSYIHPLGYVVTLFPISAGYFLYHGIHLIT